MKNQAFQTQTEAECRKKLDAALRQLTGDRLTEEQRRLVWQAVGWHRQYTLQILENPGTFCREVNPKNGLDGLTVYHTIFGDLEELGQEAAVLVCRQTSPGRPRTVYIYLPKKKEEDRDDARKEETTEP